MLASLFPRAAAAVVRPRLGQVARSRASPRCLFTTSPIPHGPSPTVALVAKLRKETQCSISKAREAIAATEAAGYDAALQWLHDDQAAAGAKKAAKLGSRVAAEGLVHALSLDAGKRAAIVEVNAETDFVARSKDFVDLVGRVGATAIMLGHDESRSTSTTSLLSTVPLDFLRSAPRLPGPNDPPSPSDSEAFKTVQEDVTDTIGRLGENIQIRRAVVTSVPDGSSSTHVVGSYVHAGGDSSIPRGFGRIGGLVVLASSNPLAGSENMASLHAFANKVAQHVVGYGPVYVAEGEVTCEPEDQETADEHLDRVVLLRQPFLFGGGTIKEALDGFARDELKGCEGLRVEKFVRFECGEGIEKKEDNFVEEVMKQAGL